MEPHEEITPSEREQRPYIGRFAPSPTGPLHFGSLVTAVASYVDARAHRGQWLIRIEDIDTPRCSPEAEQLILNQLAAYGFLHDGEIVRQSERLSYYDNALNRLAQSGMLYACQCTRKTLADAPKNIEGERIYPGTCEPLALPLDAPHTALRLALIPGEAEVQFHDRHAGIFTQDVHAELGDFVLKRADGLHAYQFAVVIDDALQGITDVVRGADLLMNTPRQIILQRELWLPMPRYMHVPLVTNRAGEKLSKQTLAEAISLDAPLPTLQAAWQFLGQGKITGVRGVKGFWQKAFALWNSENMPKISPMPKNL